MSANHAHPRSIRAHVFDLTAACATHVSDPALGAASPLPRRYTLAGFPPGNLRARRSERCG
jgi:hypothetical protein